MSYTNLLEEEEYAKCRTYFRVEINLESSKKAEIAAKKLRELGKELENRGGCCWRWAGDLADIIERKD